MELWQEQKHESHPKRALHLGASKMLHGTMVGRGIVVVVVSKVLQSTTNGGVSRPHRESPEEPNDFGDFERKHETLSSTVSI